MLVRVGDSQLGVHNTDPGTALPVSLDYLSARGAVVRTVALPRDASGGRVPCTLSHGDPRAGSDSWWLDTEGLPSRASRTEDVVLLPCHGSPAGAPLAALLRDNKTIATLGASATRDDVATLPFVGYTGVRGTGTGLRQAASLDGRSGFWVAGIANSRYGVRHVAPGSTRATRVHGSTFYSAANATAESLRYQPATLDVRGVALFGARLLLTSSYAVERNRDVPPTHPRRGWTPWGGLVLIGDDAAPAPPRTSAALSTLARGFSGRLNYWTFVFENAHSLWLVQDTSRYRPASQAEAQAFEDRTGSSALANGDGAYEQISGNGAMTRPVNLRTALGTTLVRWVWRDSAWQEEPAARVAIPGVACYSLAGRDEGGATGWVAYTTSRTTLYRIVTATRTLTEVRRAPAGTLYRGVVLPPLQPRGGPAPPLLPVPASLVAEGAPAAPSPAATPATARTEAPKSRGV